MKKILVVGASGSLGSQVVKQLSQKDFAVMAGTRNLSKINQTGNITPFHLDLDNLETYNKTLKNMDGVFLMAAPMDPLSDKKLIPFIDSAKKQGVKQIVLASSLGIDKSPEAGLFKIEKYLENSGLNFTILRPNFFMDNFTTGFVAHSINTQNAIYLPASDAKTSFISAHDIASVAVNAFENPLEYNTKIFNLTGREALNHYQIAESLTKVLGKTITYVPLSEEEFRAGGKKAGMPEPSLEMTLFLYSVVRAGYMEFVTNEFEKATNKKPLLFNEFLNIL